MTLWKRTPRSVYTVYGEQEYLSAEELDTGTGAQQPSPAIVSEPKGASRSRRLLGFALLVGVTFSAIALVVMNSSHQRAASRPGTRQGAPVNQAGVRAVRRTVTDAQTLPRTHSRAHGLPTQAPVSREETHHGTFAEPERLTVDSAQAGPVRPPVAESSATQPMRSVRSDSLGNVELIDGEFDFER
jgi:hypothetical protein